MIIGSLNIEKENSLYTISTASTITCGNEHPLCSLLFQSFQCNDKFSLSYSNSISSLYDFIQSNRFTINTATLLLHSMNTQIQFLLEKNIAISFIDLNDVMVIDEQFFYFCNVNKLYTIRSNKTILITDFYNVHNSFLPPEFIPNTNLPFSAYYTSAFYSLAIIILFCLKNSKTRVCDVFTSYPNEEVGYVYQNVSVYQDVLNEYQHTKIYLSLKHCMIKEPKQRRLFLL